MDDAEHVEAALRLLARRRQTEYKRESFAKRKRALGRDPERDYRRVAQRAGETDAAFAARRAHTERRSAQHKLREQQKREGTWTPTRALPGARKRATQPRPGVDLTPSDDEALGVA